MTYKILIEKPAMKFIQKQPKPQQESLLQAIAALPEQGDRKPMTGHSGLFRLRVGSYRILYSVEDNILVVHVLNAGNRGDIYKSYQ